MKDYTPNEHRAAFPSAWVLLSPERVAAAHARGHAWHDDSTTFADNLQNRTIKNNIDGALGEEAVSVYVDIPVNPGLRLCGDHPDLGATLNVRTRLRWEYEFNFKEKDNDDHRCILVTVMEPYLVVRGWAWGYICRRAPAKDHGGYNRPAHFVPNRWLVDPDTLLAIPKQDL